MVKLVDTTDLKSVALRGVRVRIPFPAPISPLEMIYGGWFIDYDYGDENVV